MQLYGSTSSPFVRRLRLLLAERPHEFISLNIFESADRERLIALNPTRKVPMLADGEQVVFDSGVNLPVSQPEIFADAAELGAGKSADHHQCRQ